MTSALLFAAGLVLGLVVGLWVAHLRLRDARRVAERLLAEAGLRHREEAERMLAQLKESFSSLSLDALTRNTEQFLALANERLHTQTQKGKNELASKKEMIDQTLQSMKAELAKVERAALELEKDRKAKFAVLAEQMDAAAQETRKLRQTTATLTAALANTQVRGQWGERMAEDVLRLAGFLEGINYRKQQVTGDDRARPDFTFLLPQGRQVHMDVKFPLDHYLGYVAAQTESERERCLTQFVRDSRQRVDEVTKRDYIGTTADTLDYVLVFIPNEQVYAFLNEHDPKLIDQALAKKVILCSPVTLYAVLAVIRQAVDNFYLEQTAEEILALLAEFNKQWDKFTEAMDKVGRKIDDSQRAFGELMTTRRNTLERPLRKIEMLKTQPRAPLPPAATDEPGS